MNNNLFNTSFECMLRALLLLSETEIEMNMDRIFMLDFISIYGKNCHVLTENLHGDNMFSFSELVKKRKMMSDAICMAVQEDFITVIQSENGFQYLINKRGKDFTAQLKCPYEKQYRINVRAVTKEFSKCSDSELLKIIGDKSLIPGVFS